ncbi:hypothetical protein ACIQUM_33820, partial [Amycolatopsis azurea]
SPRRHPRSLPHPRLRHHLLAQTQSPLNLLGPLTPYKVGERLLLDVQQVFPLPEAADLTVQLRRRESQARAARSDGRDWTPYAITTPEGTTEPLRKRQAVLALVQGLHAAGVPAANIAVVLPNSRFLSFEGVPSDDEVVGEFIAAYPKAKTYLGRWFVDAPLREADRTWILSKMWGRTTEAILSKLLALAPEGQPFGYEAKPQA